MGLKFIHSATRPPTTYHSFILTEENSSKTYVTCLTFYQKLSEPHVKELKSSCDRWRSLAMTKEDIDVCKIHKKVVHIDRL